MPMRYALLPQSGVGAASSLLVCIQSSAARLLRRMADPRAQHMAVGRGTEGAGSAWYAVVVWQLLCSEAALQRTTAQPDAPEWLWRSRSPPL